MSYPRIVRINNNKVDEVILHFYDSNHAIEINKNLCTGCSICVKICPKGAILQDKKGKIKVKTEDLIPKIPDADKCSYCGSTLPPHMTLKIRKLAGRCILDVPAPSAPA